MVKKKVLFVCQECGYESPKWMGKCPSCNNWNTMIEGDVPNQKTNINKISSKPISIKDIKYTGEFRFTSGMAELDRVLGGGVVPGSLVLLGGDPGIGKSTLLIQVCSTISKQSGIVLYATGEESTRQIKMRADRLSIQSEGLFIVSENNIGVVLEHVKELKPTVLIIDSIQTMYSDTISSAPGSVSQVREVTACLMKIAKENSIAVVIVGHVTKQGSIAGPRVLEHMVDTVLYFEGERHYVYRILRAVKNRFGSTNEVGLFRMTGNGLEEVSNPSEFLMSDRHKDTVGSATFCSIEGTRPLIVEIQSLVSMTGFGVPRRMTTGIDYNRVTMLMAVLEKKLGMQLSNQDAYVNAAGGMKIDEPGSDLAVATAIASSFRNKSINWDTVVMGEVGLTGEIRAINQIEKRVYECIKLGFKECILPISNLKSLKNIKGIKIKGVANLGDALEALF